MPDPETQYVLLDPSVNTFGCKPVWLQAVKSVDIPLQVLWVPMGQPAAGLGSRKNRHGSSKAIPYIHCNDSGPGQDGGGAEKYLSLIPES